MIRTTSFLMFGAIASLFIVGITSMDEAYAFEPTKKEQKVINLYAKTTLKVEEHCSDEENREKFCDRLENKQDRLLFKLNDMGIFVDGQEPTLTHLTEEYDSTRAAAQAGIEPIEPEDNLTIGLACSNCGDPKTMYVKSAYKDQYIWFGIPLWSHYAGPDSTDISTGQTTSASFQPRWSGTNSGLVPYCQSSSVDLPANANYALSMLTTTTYGASLESWIDTKSSSFTWYHTHEQYGDQMINNLADGMNITCSLSSVTVN